jgi:hypothetical protein
MPYITQQRRNALASTLTPKPDTAKNAGELNYAITLLLIQYWQEHGRYQAINDISGACTEALAEFRRRVVGKYEDTKITENGDVYP